MSELTTSRINRQFRTLRNKCSALNSFTPAPSRPKVSVTYGRSSRGHAYQSHKDDETPPLAILQSLDKLGSRLHLDRAIVENMQLSKRIYEVRDAFKNIVQAAFGATSEELHGLSPVASLTSICARVIGEHVQSEMDASLEDVPDVDGEEDSVRSEAMDDIYESVPAQHRQYTLVAHALTYILDTCPSHPTLLNALLEVCLGNGLSSEARIVLFELFTTAIVSRPKSACICPLTHPAHKNFLSTLRDTCISPIPTFTAFQPVPASVINNRTYTSTLVDALLRPCPEQMHAWTSKAITRLARDLRDQDFGGCFVPLCIGFAHALHSAVRSHGTNPKTVPTSSSQDPELLSNTQDRLAKWIVSMLNTLRTRTSSDDSTQTYIACVDFLVNVQHLQLHISFEPATSPSTGLADALCCLAAYCISSPPQPPFTLSDGDVVVLHALLREAHVKNTTFESLLSYILPLPNFTIFRESFSQGEDDASTSESHLFSSKDGIPRAIDALATPLRTGGLFQCEASMYLCALHHVEELISAPNRTAPSSMGLNDKELYDVRLQLMDRVEEAERRCYGGANGSPPPPPEGGEEWRWEEIVGSWVVKSPAVARAKMKEKELGRASKRHKLSDSTESSASTAPSSRGVSYQQSEEEILPDDFYVPSSDGYVVPYTPVPASKKRAGSSLTGTTRTGSCFDNGSKENFQHANLNSPSDDNTLTPVPRAAKRPSGGFATILADAHLNRISLREEREAKAREAMKVKAKGRVSAPARVVHFTVPDSPASAFGSPATATLATPAGFRTALADSHRNVIRLNEERARARLTATAVAPKTPKANTVCAGVKRKRIADSYGRNGWLHSNDEDDIEVPKREYVEPESSPARPGYVEPSSDDALNLFAYPDSSPVKYRREVR